MAIEAELQRIQDQMLRVKALIDEGGEKLGRRAPKVSGWSVGEQIDHLLKVLERGFSLLLTSETKLPKGINLTGRVILAVGRIPRGVGKSPASVRGAERPAPELLAQLRLATALLEKLRSSPDRFVRRQPIFPHPYFGGLDAARAVRFLAIHTDHHLRIVTDIRRATGS